MINNILGFLWLASLFFTNLKKAWVRPITPVGNQRKFQRVKSTFLKTAPRRCFYCYESLAASKLTIDHIIPLSKGGDPYSFKNLVVSCSRCNGLKANKMFSEAS